MITDNFLKNYLKENIFKLLPKENIRIRKIEVKKDRKFGFHIIHSPRFICHIRGEEETGKQKNFIIFIKNRSNAGQEFQKMSILWSQHYSIQHKYLIPRPLFYDEKYSLLFLEHYNGVNFLTSLYKQYISHYDKYKLLEETVIPAARWLADFQSIYHSVESSHPPQIILDFEKKLDSCVVFREIDKQQIVMKMREISSHFPHCPDTFVHGQYLFRNILFRNGVICVLDFPDQRIGWPLYDFFRFLIGIDRLSQYPLIPISLRKLLKNCFIEEYILHSDLGFAREDLKNLWGLFVVGYIREIYPKRKGARGILNDRFVYHTLKRLVSWSET